MIYRAGSLMYSDLHTEDSIINRLDFITCQLTLFRETNENHFAQVAVLEREFIMWSDA